MAKPRPRVRVAVKYCGSCNPQVNLTALVTGLREVARRRGFELMDFLAAEGQIDVLVLLCGCPRTCADRPDVRARARRTLLVAGESLSGTPVPEAKLPAALARELARLVRASP